MSHRITVDQTFAQVPTALLVDGRVSGTDIRVYGLLLRHADVDRACWPSHARLAELAHVSTSTVKRSIRTLEEADWLVVKERFADGAQSSNWYHLRTSSPSTSDDDPQVTSDLPPGHPRPTPQVADDLPPRSPVTYEREPLNESHRTNTRTTVDHSDADDVDVEACFDEWYAEYPRKAGKGAARKAYAKALDRTTRDTLLVAVRAFARLCKAQGTEKRYIAHPATWLNQERWDDDLAVDEPTDPFEGPPMRFY